MSVMATPPNDDTRTLFKLIADGEWHRYEEVRDALASTVPPGRALRKYEERLEASRRHHQTQSGQPMLTDDEMIFYGQRACAQVTISSWKDKGKGIIQRIENGVKEIKVKPGFKAWGILPPEQGVNSPETAQGHTEVPPADSEPSEGADGAQAVADSTPVEHVQILDVDPPEVKEKIHSDAVEESYRWPSHKVTAEALPECPECGLGVINAERHDRWHEAQKHPEMALFDEKALRTLLGDVTRQELDQFQQGMQLWLQVQFSQLEAAFGAHTPLTPRWTLGNDQRS